MAFLAHASPDLPAQIIPLVASARDGRPSSRMRGGARQVGRGGEDRAMSASNNNHNNNNDNNNNNSVLQQLLNLQKLAAPVPDQDEVSQILSAELVRWRGNPRLATIILSGLAKHRLPLLARSVLISMLASRVEANVFHYNTAISACEKAGHWQLALHFFSSMPDLKLAPNKITYSATMSACEKAGQWQLALSLLSRMPEMRVVQDEITYNAAISACEKGGQWQLALSLLSSMTSVRIIPNEISYNAAISACEKAGRWKVALHLLSSIFGCR
ncbi:unnamed protein product [Polarella glacialis]|uniref:Pentatricopeptide repeat-containing protein, chloroplastic n=1 Tax=Polarella glacialis TaxID=89957 RepID=A0A813LRM9_POLGL|nr:unnamed protein product [Polarella glacialis]